MKTGVQEIGKVLKTLDSGFRRNDGEKTQIVFFTPFLGKGGRGGLKKITILYRLSSQRGEKAGAAPPAKILKS
jgi:hypothetical protein